MTERFEVAVIGGGRAAAMIAALLSKKKYAGVLIDQGESSLWCGPTLVPARSRAAKLVHDTLQLPLEVKNGAVDKALKIGQIAEFDERLCLYTNRASLLEHITRICPKEAPSFSALLSRLDELLEESTRFLDQTSELPPYGFLAKRAYRGLLERHPDLLSPSLPKLERFEAALPFLCFCRPTNGTEPQIEVLRLVRGLHALLVEAPYVLKTPREDMISVAESGGFHFLRAHVERIESSSGAIELEADGRSIRVDAVVDASSQLDALGLWPGGKLSAKQQGGLYSVSIEVDADVVPPGMDRWVVLLDAISSVEGPVLIEQDAREGRISLRASTPVNSPPSGDEVMTFEARIVARLEQLIPFLMDGAPEFGVAAWPPLHRYYASGARPVRTRVKNLFAAGAAVLPELGVEGEYLSALYAVDAVEQLRRGIKPAKNFLARLQHTAK